MIELTTDVVVVLNYSPAQSPERLISATAAAQKLGVDIDTLVRWHRRHSGPAGYQVAGGAGLAYRNRDIEAWQDRCSVLAEIGATTPRN